MHRWAAHVYELPSVPPYRPMFQFGDFNEGETHSSVQRYEMFGEYERFHAEKLLFCNDIAILYKPANHFVGIIYK